MDTTGDPEYEYSGSDGDSENDTSFDSEVSSLTPQMKGKQNFPVVPVKKNICFIDIQYLQRFIEQINQIRVCATPDCGGKIVPTQIKSIGLGGAITIHYACDGCVTKFAQLEASPNYDGIDNMTEVGMAVQVAFIVAGLTHTTYQKTLKSALGINAVCPQNFQNTINMMYPIVKEVLDAMCEEAKKEMRDMDPTQLGSWSRAVTSADGTWMTRGFHSKNATFSIRNYYNGALLYYKHLCQKGRDSIIEEELYQGTSKGAEGYAASGTFGVAKEEGMVIEVHWQDADSSSSNALTEHFPDAKVMICGGHAGRAHKKQLEKLAKMRSFTEDFKKKHCKKFPMVNEVACCCPNRHSPGCGCMSDAFIEKARNNFSFVLSEAESAESFATKLLVLPRHARDEHEWDSGRCDFHQLCVCSCGNCKDKEEPDCAGKPYSTKHILSCPLHSLAYEIEINERASMANDLVHPILKRGHSNWLEASHNVLIRFRPKHIFLERLHYEVSTNLGLLQSNMTYMYNKRGPRYHWVPELFKRLKLPIYDGLQEHLESQNRKRKNELDYQKTENRKRRRIELKRERTKDAQHRKEWSKKHGHHTYGEDSSTVASNTTKKVTAAEAKCKCGSLSHKRTSHRDCPFNKKHQKTDRVNSFFEECAKVSTDSDNVDENDSSASTGTFEVGDYVCIHHNSLQVDKKHIPCRVVLVVDRKYRLFCDKGIFKRVFSSNELKSLSSSDRDIPLEDWRLACAVSLHEVSTDPACLESCNCNLDSTVPSGIHVDLTQTPDIATKSNDWVKNTLYTLDCSNREEVTSPFGWLSDNVIEAAQLLILQQFPHMSGLQTPILQTVSAFQVHRGEFVQIINVGNSHWCTVSNIGCDKDGVVNVYDTLYPSVSNDTIRIIASLIYSDASKLVVQMMDIERQSNGSDCGVLAIAIAYDICSGNGPCSLKYDHRSIRQHLAKCLESCNLSRFPIVCERRSRGVTSTRGVDLHCSCRMPDFTEIGNKMAECDGCKKWYHKHCQDIPNDVFCGEDIPWMCKACHSLKF